ncbi:MAG: FtsX-like permease family protein [Bacteroidota bacterium]
MTKNHLLVALRRLRRRPGTTALHVGGLAVGLLCCFLALLYVLHVRAYDRHHEHADRIVRIEEDLAIGDMTIFLIDTDAETVEAIRTDVPGVVAAAVVDAEQGLARRPDGLGVAVEQMLYADSAFADVFTVPMLAGTLTLDQPDAAVLTASLAATLFGDSDPIGATVEVERTGHHVRGIDDPTPLALTVTGVVADPPATSTLAYDLLVSGRTVVDLRSGRRERLARGGETFVRLDAMADTTALLAQLTARGEARERQVGQFGGAKATPLLALHEHDQLGAVSYLMLFGVLATLVLLLACINYANLATALALRRATEVGVRKVLGAGRRQLAGQFFAEAFLLAAAAGVVALSLATLTLPSFRVFMDEEITLFGLGSPAVFALAAVVAAAALFAGAYPALTLARFRPAAVLKGERLQGRGGRRIRQGLVVVQFAATAVLLAGTAVVAQQVRYAQTRDLGFRGDQTVVFNLDDLGLAREAAALRDALGGLTAVRAASITSGVPGDVNALSLFSNPSTAADPTDDRQLWLAEADPAYLDAVGLDLIAGRWFGAGESPTSFVVNETAARTLGLMTDDPAAAIGQTIVRQRSDGAPLEIVGVVSDFHFATLRRDIEGLGFAPLDEQPFKSLLAVRLAADDLRSSLGALEAAWADVAPGYPFVPSFVDEVFAEEFAEDRTLGRLVGGIALVAVLLALFGLLGLSAYAAEQRTKEIGVRKVLGARVGQLVGLLARDFVALVGVALVVAVPIVVLLARPWLDNFAYPAPQDPAVFLGIGLGLLVLAAAAVSVHAFRAATADPVRTLRHE